MKRVLLTGATGFIGRHVLQKMKNYNDLEIICSARGSAITELFGCRYISYTIRENSEDPSVVFGRPDILIHLSWQGLPNYNQPFHFEKNLIANYNFIKKFIESGTKEIVVAGTCYEYGLKNGMLSETDECSPVTAYGIAKDSLRRFLEHLEARSDCELKWLRLFFTYGEGQHESSLIPQLNKAIESGIGIFEMSGGEQLRDYMPVEELAEMIVKVSIQRKIKGIINICSGKPVSVRTLVENYLRGKGKNIQLKLGAFSYPSYEPMAFWGDNRKLCAALEAFDEGCLLH